MLPGPAHGHGMAPARCVNRMTGRRCHSWGRPGKVGKKRSRGQGTQPPKEDAAAEVRPKGRTARLYLRPPILILAGGAVVGARARGSNPAKSLRRRRNYVMHVILARCARHGLPYLRDSISLLKTCRTFFSPLSLSGRKMKHGRRRRARAPAHTAKKFAVSNSVSFSPSDAHSSRPRCSGGGRYDCFLIVSGDKSERGRAGKSDLLLRPKFHP